MLVRKFERQLGLALGLALMGVAIGAAVLLGGIVGAEVDFTVFSIRRYFGQAVFGRLYGVAFGIFLIGSGTGPVLASASFDHFVSYRPGALLLAAGALVVVLLTFAMPGLPNPQCDGQPAP